MATTTTTTVPVPVTPPTRARRLRLARILGQPDRFMLSVDGCSFTLSLPDLLGLGAEVTRVLTSVEGARTRDR